MTKQLIIHLVIFIFILQYGKKKKKKIEKKKKQKKEELRKKFPDCFIDRTQGRVYLHLPVIKGNDHDVIAEKLSEYYFYMKDLTSRIK